MQQAAQIAKQKATNERIAAAAKAGVYSIKKEEYGTFVELSDEEIYGRYFDAKRLSTTLDISIEDAEMLNSKGKTYVFAKTEAGSTIELYHADLSCNYLSISISEASPERVAEFEPKDWQSAPYAHLVGQTSAANHFVC